MLEQTDELCFLMFHIDSSKAIDFSQLLLDKNNLNSCQLALKIEPEVFGDCE